MTTSPYTLLTQACGLSHGEAAQFLGVRLDTAKSWAHGKRNAPPRVFEELRALDAAIERAASLSLLQISSLCRREYAPAVIVLRDVLTDAEAQAQGLPCVGAHRAMLSRVVSRCARPIRIVPRG